MELKKNRDAWIAAEKVRKEKWERDKVQEIRAQTVKGLEPEIQRIVERNKDELRKQDERHAQSIREIKEQILLQHDAKVQEVREKLLAEREVALDAEREKSQNKLHEQYQRLESQFNDERMRWKSNVYGEYDRIEALRKRENEALEDQLSQMKIKVAEELANERAKHEKKLEEAERRHAAELRNLKDSQQEIIDAKLQEMMRRCEEDKREMQEKARE